MRYENKIGLNKSKTFALAINADTLVALVEAKIMANNPDTPKYDVEDALNKLKL